MKRVGQGFTLIELMITMLLIGVMIAIAVPSFASFISNYRATGAVNDLLEAISLTRTEALKRGRKVTLMANDAASHKPSAGASWKNGWTIFVDLNSDQALTLTGTTPDLVIAQHEALPSSMTASGSPDNVTAPFGGTNIVIFDGSGYPRTPASATLIGGIVFTDQIGSQSNVRTLCLAAYGRPRIIKNAPAPNCT